MKIDVFADDESAARAAAGMIALEARAAVAARGRFVMAVSGGRTELVEKLGGHDPCPCGSGRRFQPLAQW